MANKKPAHGFAAVAAAAHAPAKALSVIVALSRARWCRLSCWLRGVRFDCGRNLRVYGRLSIKGPGRVCFGDNVVVDGTVTPWTYHADAVIHIGSDTFLNGTQFGCVRSIVIGPHCILSRISIMDTNFHSTSINRHDPNAPVKVSPVQIGSNVWIAAQAGVLPGTTIGDNSVVGFGAVCSGTYPADVLIAGTSATVVRRLDD